MLVALAAAAALAQYGLSRSGEETPETAIYGLAHDLEHDDVSGVCERLFLRRLLPAAAARSLGVSPGTGGSWDAERRRCVHDFKRGDDYQGLEFEEPRVRSVASTRLKPHRGVTATATALITLGHEAPTTVKLVEFREKWRIVIDGGSPSTYNPSEA